MGSGTLDAAGGRFFSTVEPITGYTESYHKNGVKMSDIVEGIGEETKTIAIDARKVSGEVVDPHGDILTAIQDCKNQGSIPIVHTVYGSKTGICLPIDNVLKSKAEELGGLYVIDACQGRFEIEWLKE